MSLRRSTPITSEHSGVDTPRAIDRKAPQLIGGGAANAMLSLITVDAKDMTEISLSIIIIISSLSEDLTH